ncbi:MAG: DinB family protein [Gemmatimonadales bacterium]
MRQEWIATILIRELETLKQELAAMPDEASVWAVRPGVTNSVGTLTLHLAGNLSHFIGAVLGGSGYVRHRDREFGDRDVPRAQLVEQIDGAIAAIRTTFERPIDLAADFPEVVGGGFRVSTGDMLLQLVSHTGFHLGQLGYLRRILTGEAKSTGPLALGRLTTARKA